MNVKKRLFAKTLTVGALAAAALPPGIAPYFLGTPPCNLLSATITGYLMPNQ